MTDKYDLSPLGKIVPPIRSKFTLYDFVCGAIEFFKHNPDRWVKHELYERANSIPVRCCLLGYGYIATGIDYALTSVQNFTDLDWSEIIAYKNLEAIIAQFANIYGGPMVFFNDTSDDVGHLIEKLEKIKQMSRFSRAGDATD